MNSLPAMTFDNECKVWEFTFVLPSGKEGKGRVSPYDSNAPLSEEFKAQVGAFTRWLQKSETKVRAYITQQMFDMWQSEWHDDEYERVRTPPGFQRKIAFRSFHIYEDPEDPESQSAELFFNDGNLFGDHSIVLDAKLDGTLECEPYLAG